MDLRDYVRVLRGRWRLIILCALVAVGIASAWSIHQTPKYEASTQLFVAAKSTDVSGAYQGDLFSRQRVKSYSDIVNSPPVVTAVVASLRLNMTPGQVASEITADAPTETVLLNVHVTDAQPKRAQAIANAVSEEFAVLASKLETPTGSTTSPVKVSVVKAAALPGSPVSPRTRLNIVAGALVGLMIGVGLAIARETLDTSVKHLDDLAQELDVAPLGVVLYDPEAAKRPLIVHAAGQSSRAEAFRQLRTNLQFVDVDSAPRSILVTSSVPEEGKSTTTANLAISLAQAGVRVCLVEGDLRRPRLVHYLGLEGAAGLTNVLIGKATLDEVLQPWGDGKLSVLACGPTPPNPSELLGARSMAEVLRELEDRFDLVIIDAPPLLPVTDAAVLASQCSGALLVIRHGKTKKEQVRRAVEALRSVDANIYGVVLNMAPAKGPDAYYYGYAYRYDYKPSQPPELKPAQRSGQSTAAVSSTARTVLPADEPFAQASGASSVHVQAPSPYATTVDNGGGSSESAYESPVEVPAESPLDSPMDSPYWSSTPPRGDQYRD
jgi:non-specific protein-tyrosine kinase